MHITQEADYALRIVFALSRKGLRMDAPAISEETAVTRRFALKILHKLVKAGVVKSFKGPKGGYELAREPKEINMLEVITVIDGPVLLSKCLRPGAKCSREAAGVCYFESVFRGLSDDLASQFRKTDFASAVRREDAMRKKGACN